MQSTFQREILNSHSLALPATYLQHGISGLGNVSVVLKL